jgi:hypothetical protein
VYTVGLVGKEKYSTTNPQKQPHNPTLRSASRARSVGANSLLRSHTREYPRITLSSQLATFTTILYTTILGSYENFSDVAAMTLCALLCH